MNLAQNILAVAETHPTLPAIIDPSTGRVFTYRELIENVQAFAGGLLKQGIKPGDRVALLIPNSPEFIFLMLAVWRLSATAVPIGMGLGRIELDEILANADPDLLIVQAGSLKPPVKKYLKGKPVYVAGGATGDYPSLFKLKDSGRLDLPDFNSHQHSLACIIYTYRGLGYPLGAMIPHEQIWRGATLLRNGHGTEPGQKMLVILPLAHILSLVSCLLMPLMGGMGIVLCDSVKPSTVFSLIEKHRIYTTAVIPELLGLWLKFDIGDYDVSSLKLILSGGSDLRRSIWRAIVKKLKVEVLHGYGLTEITPVSGNTKGKSHLGTVGPVVKDVDYRIHQPDGKGRGELQLKSDHLFVGYNKREREYAESFLDGWFRTGDICHLEKGYLVFDREKKQTRKKNGRIVDLVELKNVFEKFPLIKKAEVRSRNGRTTVALTLIDPRHEPNILEMKKTLALLLSAAKGVQEILIKT